MLPALLKYSQRLQKFRKLDLGDILIEAEDEVIPFQEATRAHLEKLAQIHISAMSYSLNARLGVEHLVDLYELMQTDQNVLGSVYFHKQEPVGLCLGTTNLQLTQRGLSKTRRAMLKVLLNPLFTIKNLGNLIDYFEISSINRKLTELHNYILLWFVSPGSRNSGIGKKLLTELLEQFSAKNTCDTFVDVRKASTSAVHNYKQAGFSSMKATRLSLILIRRF